MEEYVLAAIDKGLAGIFFLEHMETNVDYFESTWLTDEDFDRYFAEGRRLQEIYSAKLNIGLGVEVGYNPGHLAETQKRLTLHQWDRIGLSYHFIRADYGYLNVVSKKQINLDYSKQLGTDGVISSYYTGLREAVENIPADVLCHLDAVLRHIPNISYSTEHERLINELLDAIAARGMAVEVNMSGYPIRGEPYPSIALLKEVVSRGIPLVAGSDAHRPEDVGRYFDRLPALQEKITD